MLFRMNITVDTQLLVIAFFCLVALSGCFSAAETAMMALNRYRLAHWVRAGRSRAVLVQALLKRPDRLLGVILIGNTFANILAASIATALAIHWLGEQGVWLATCVVTVIVLLGAEIFPKTLAACFPGRFALLLAWPLRALLVLLYPLVWLANGLVNGILRLFGVRVTEQGDMDQLSIAELRSAVFTNKQVSSQRQQMLLRILELESIAVEDVMVPRSQIVGIDVQATTESIEKKIRHSRFHFMPLYDKQYEQLLGMLDVTQVLLEMLDGAVCDADNLRAWCREPYFIPEGTPISQQLMHFQKNAYPQALVVDEYGDVLGLLAKSDIEDEIMGEWGSQWQALQAPIKQRDSMVVSGNLAVRSLNRRLHWQLPTDGPRSLSGLLIEYLEVLPQGPVCVKMHGHLFEVMTVSKRQIIRVRVYLKDPKTS